MQLLRIYRTPIDTAPIVIYEGIALICVAKILRSGSAIVIIVPRMKSIKITYKMFFLFAMWAPILWPIADIEISAPRVKSPIPKIKRIVPIKKVAIVSDGSGTKVKAKSKTIKEIGRIDDKASFILDLIFSFTLSSPYL